MSEIARRFYIDRLVDMGLRPPTDHVFQNEGGIVTNLEGENRIVVQMWPDRRVQDIAYNAVSAIGKSVHQLTHQAVDISNEHGHVPHGWNESRQMESALKPKKIKAGNLTNLSLELVTKEEVDAFQPGDKTKLSERLIVAPEGYTVIPGTETFMVMSAEIRASLGAKLGEVGFAGACYGSVAEDIESVDQYHQAGSVIRVTPLRSARRTETLHYESSVRMAHNVIAFNLLNPFSGGDPNPR